ncbi:hypothetical protein [Chryseobacterium sp. BIGb0232]|uniref:hypothetical protein n=1 Tax=Chryseobacterium sp. BIGb0232 TaxID=2940598 RepID=UPI000F9619D2|nr:hypothetical protein [Chryseobacterium sp. BIGb0232]MCS4302649.1 hypothetical protein [Chryseobacterium sp. BIGb0232]ROS17303.1 hypothetical protein EDF65_1667 [Chryseobacterium nakagawai]
MKKIYVSISMLLVFQLYSGQASPEPNNNYGLPKIVAPSQETFASSRISFEQSSNGDFTHQVPVYTQLRTPISLNYSSGVRADDIGTSTGMSWMLTAPGVISRVVKDETDENNTNWKPETVNETANLAQIREAARTGNEMDTEYDWFNFSIANGLSGSFYINNTLQVFTESKDKVKIEITDLNLPVFGYGKLFRFKLTDKTGTEYYFGGAVENIERSTTQSAGPDRKAITGWYLYKIISPDKRETNFTYITEPLTYYSSLNAGFSLLGKCPSASSGSQYTYNDIVKSKVIQQSYKPRLTLISEDDKNVSFMYGKARNDLFNSNAENNLLTSIEVKNGNLLIEKFNLEYQDVASSAAATYYGIPSNETSTRNRHFLTSLKNVTRNTSTDFSYYSPEKLPARFSLDTDYFGYPNNKSNSSPFPAPRPTNNFGIFQSFGAYMPLTILSANKEVEPSWASIGNLKQITHPTKGISEIFYDPNSSAGATTKEVMELGGVEALYTPCDPSHNFPTGTFTFVSNGTDIHYFAAAGPYPAQGCYEPEPKLVKHTLTITDETTGTNVRTAAGNGTKELDSKAPGSSAIATVAGHTYKATYTVKGVAASSGVASIYYNAHNVTTYEPVYFGGSRVSSIKESDIEGDSYTRKFYYNSLANISSPKTSVADFNLNYIGAKAGETSMPCTSGSNNFPSVEIVNIYTGSQNNLLPNFNHRKNKVTYTDITEVIENKSAIEKKFSYIPNAEYNIGRWPAIYNIPGTNSGEEKSYLLLEENRYQYENVAFKKQLVKTYKYEYSQLKSLKSYVFKENFTYNPNPNEDQLLNISYGSYENYYGFYNLTEVKTTESLPDGSAMTSTSFSSYGNPNHHQVTSSKTVYADGSARETTYQYAHEKGNQKLINANMIGVPLETAVTKIQNGNSPSGKIISKMETRYDDPATLFPTSVISTGLQSNTTTEVMYDQYDSKGNIQQYTTKDGIPTVIIWGYNKTQPIAEIKGAKLTDILQSLINLIVNASNTDELAEINNDETVLLKALRSFRERLPEYQISTYTYDPLVGIRSITPPSGITEFYYYDSANRLDKVIDANGKILKEMKYNYKN